MAAEQGIHQAVLIPGGNYGAQAGLLAYVGEAVARRSADVQRISWTPPVDQPLEDRARWVHQQVVPYVEPGAAPLLIGKSLGSYGASVAAELGVPAVWLTPLLTMPPCVEALRRASQPFLLVGGTADQFWDGDLARSLTSHVLEVDGADHGLLVPGPMSESAAVLSLVLTTIEAFLNEVVWS